MKRLIIPLIESDAPCCGSHSFQADWCLDLFGYINTNGEFQGLLKQINDYIKAYPLLSQRSKKRLTLGLCGLFALISTIFGLSFGMIIPSLFHSQNGKSGDAMSFYILMGLDVLTLLLIIVCPKIVNAVAMRRANAFDQAMNSLLGQINLNAYPTAYWKLIWREVLTHYSIEMKANGKGKAIPRFSEHAEIIIEINDGLSSRTAPSIHVKLPPIVSTIHPSQMVAVV